jgi:integrase/recombinase XerD
LQTTPWLPRKCLVLNHLSAQNLANNILLAWFTLLGYKLAMLSEFYKSRTRIQALRDGRAGALLESFARALSEAGYSTITACHHLRAAEHFVNWTNSRGMPVRNWNEQSLTQFDRHLSRCYCPHYAHSMNPAVIQGVRRFLTHVRGFRIDTLRSIKPPVRDPALVQSFSQWMRQQRGTGEVTIHNYRIYIRELLQRFGENPSRFDARRLRAFVLEKSRSGGWGTAKNCTHALRMFLRFLIVKGQCAVGLDAAIPTVAHWRLASLPRYLPPEDVERLIASCDRASAVGRRDRAVLLLLARLGLRSSDIVHLRLSDIDWKGASIQLCGKGRRQSRLPLTQEVGQAIISYLKKGRPQVKLDTVFVCASAPFRAFGSSCVVTKIVDKALRRAGVVRPNRGAAHLLRHSLATSLLRRGTSLEDIGSILRHTSLETTQIYAKVDVASLRQIAQPWPKV